MGLGSDWGQIEVRLGSDWGQVRLGSDWGQIMGLGSD